MAPETSRGRAAVLEEAAEERPEERVEDNLGTTMECQMVEGAGKTD